jgi:hypothetical protein
MQHKSSASAPHNHEEIEAHYAALERPCACLSGWVYLGVEDDEGVFVRFV